MGLEEQFRKRRTYREYEPSVFSVSLFCLVQGTVKDTMKFSKRGTWPNFWVTERHKVLNCGR